MLSHNNMRKLFLLLFVLLALPAFAVQREVGSGQTYPTIGACITAASAGDICNVHAGTYNTAIIINKSITVQANPGDSPVINITGLGGIAVYISANGVIFDGFEVLGYGSVAVGSSGVYVNSGVVGAQIKNCKVHDGYGNGIRGNGANGPFLIDNCEIYGALQHAGVGLSGDGIDIISGTSSDGTFANGNTISNTLVHDSQIDGIKIHGQYFTIRDSHIYDNISELGAHSDGIQFLKVTTNVQHARVFNNIISNHSQNIYVECTAASPCTDLQFWGNVIYNSPGVVNGVDMETFLSAGLVLTGGAGCGEGVLVYNNTFGRHSHRAVDMAGCSDGTAEFKNNIIKNDLGNGFMTGVTAYFTAGKFDYNMISAPNNPVYLIHWNGVFHTTYAAFQAAVTNQQQNGSGGAASFVNEAGTDYHLSAATIAGLTLASPWNLDYDGVTRGGDGTWDIGAFEYVASGAPVFQTVVGTSTLRMGLSGGTQTVTITNVGNASTDGITTATFILTLPTGLTATALSGTGWGGANCTPSGLTCTRSDVLTATSSYPVLTLTYSLAKSTAPTVTTEANGTGGGTAGTSTGQGDITATAFKGLGLAP